LDGLVRWGHLDHGGMGLVRSRGQQIIKTGEHGAGSDVM
jgi:hypothetical protein